jgi:PPOX class probable F420-dependent enzyme
VRHTALVDEAELRRRFATSPVARLATVRADGQPHLVPVVFALIGDTVYTAVDAKPKSTVRLQRLANIAAEPRCSLLVDHYEDDWSQLWWVRADGAASILSRDQAADGLAELVARHAQYRRLAPPGPVVAIRVSRWTGWSATPGTAPHNPPRWSARP